MERPKIKIHGEGATVQMVPEPTIQENHELVWFIQYKPGSDTTGDLDIDDPRIRASKANKRQKTQQKSRKSKGGDKT